MNSLREFKEWVLNLNESTLDEIISYYDENVFFKDPFNEFNGREILNAPEAIVKTLKGIGVKPAVKIIINPYVSYCICIF